MSQPQLSILIPAIPSRFDRCRDLYKTLLLQAGEMNIEILMFMDNKIRTIGAKREALKNGSTGKYFMFCDDDDGILSLKEIYDATFKDVDVITFQQRCRNKDGSNFIVTFGLGNQVEHNTKEGGIYLDCKRPPWHVCAWNARFKCVSFGDVNYGEDWVFVERANEIAKTETHIPKVLHSYNFDASVSEADTSDNKYWKNPNGPQGPKVFRSSVLLADMLHQSRSNLTISPPPPIKQMKPAIVNLVSNVARYQGGQERLNRSLEVFAQAEGGYFANPLFFQSESEIGAPPHTDNPYAFKIYAIEKARQLGYSKILWLDASVVQSRTMKPVFDYMEEKGIFMEEAGHWAGSWCNDYTLNYFGITREEAMKIPMFAAGYVGFDFDNARSIEFFAQWKESMLNGCFKGSWQDHRHDMTCASIIAHRLGITDLYASGGRFFAYVGPAYAQPSETSCFQLLGL